MTTSIRLSVSKVNSCKYHLIVWLNRAVLKTVGSYFLRTLGALWLLVQVISYFLEPSVPLLQDHRWWFLAGCGLLSLYLGRPRPVLCKISGTDITIEIRVGDLFTPEGAAVVAAPTSFDTSMEDGTIDRQSAQGQYTTRFCDSIHNLDHQIQAALDGLDYEECSESEKPYGNQQLYPVGTVAPVIFQNKRAYFVAVATLNRHRVAHATRNDLLDALPKLWDTLLTRGGMEPINVPVLGSGFSRLDANATREELVREIIKSVIAATHSGKFCETLRIMISREDFLEGKIDLDSLYSFLRHECKYGTAMPSSNIATGGTAL